MRRLINLVEDARGVPTPQELTVAIRAKTAELIADGHSRNEFLINSGLCDTLAEEVVDSFGGDQDEFFAVWGDGFTAVGPDGFADCQTWDVNLLSRVSPGTHPPHGLTWEDLHGHIPNHCWIVLQGRHYDAECPEGVDNLFDIPLCRRMVRDIVIEKAADAKAAIEHLDAQVEDLNRNWVPHADPKDVAKVMAEFKAKRAALEHRS